MEKEEGKSSEKFAVREQVNCLERSNYRVFWPGRESLLMCISCKEKAMEVAEVAEAMGFYLHVEARCEPMPWSGEIEDKNRLTGVKP